MHRQIRPCLQKYGSSEWPANRQRIEFSECIIDGFEGKVASAEFNMTGCRRWINIVDQSFENKLNESYFDNSWRRRIEDFDAGC